MSIYHIHKYKSAKDKWVVGHEITTRDTNHFHNALMSNCASFIDSDSGRLIEFDYFNKYLAPRCSRLILDEVNKIRENAIKQLRKENIFEHVRAEQFPALPSRLKCLYAFGSLEFMNDWVKDVVATSRCHSSERMSYEIVELSPLGNTKFFETQDGAIYECENLTDAAIVDKAKSYWGAKCGGKKEILLEGTLQVVKVLNL